MSSEGDEEMCSDGVIFWDILYLYNSLWDIDLHSQCTVCVWGPSVV